MCGIWGILSLEEIKIKHETLFNKFMKIKHRGPDKTTFLSDKNYMIGFHRLSIMDKSPKGDQPFIYNFSYNDENGDEILKTVYVICNLHMG